MTRRVFGGFSRSLVSEWFRSYERDARSRQIFSVNQISQNNARASHPPLTTRVFPRARISRGLPYPHRRDRQTSPPKIFPVQSSRYGDRHSSAPLRQSRI